MARLSVALLPHCDHDRLATEWRAVEARIARRSPFLSWHWIGTWLRHVSVEPLLLRAEMAGAPVALALLCRTTRRRGPMRVSQLALHATGDAVEDALTIEHNGVLIADDAPDETLKACLDTIDRWMAGHGVGEFAMPGVDDRLVTGASAQGWTVEIDRAQPVFGLDPPRTPHDLLSSFSAGTRATLRQSRRLIETHGALVAEKAGDPAEARAFFEALVALHQARWRERGAPGAFANDFARRFHHDLIDRAAGSGFVELWRARAGDTVLGYLYQVRVPGRVANYQGGFVYAADNRWRPGLMTHLAYLEAVTGEGGLHYDLLAGDQRYKRALARETGRLLWIRAQRPSGLLAIERWARAARNRLRAGRGDVSGNGPADPVS